MAEEYLEWYRHEEDFDFDYDFKLLFKNSGDKKHSLVCNMRYSIHKTYWKK